MTGRKPLSRSTKVTLKISEKFLESSAFVLDTVHLPRLQKQQDKLTNTLYRHSNEMRVFRGEKPKRFKRILADGNVVEVE